MSYSMLDGASESTALTATHDFVTLETMVHILKGEMWVSKSMQARKPTTVTHRNKSCANKQSVPEISICAVFGFVPTSLIGKIPAFEQDAKGNEDTCAKPPQSN